jgi:hypothetical protein
METLDALTRGRSRPGSLLNTEEAELLGGKRQRLRSEMRPNASTGEMQQLFQNPLWEEQESRE